MVLKAIPRLILGLTMLSLVPAWAAYDGAAFDKAMALYRKKSYEPALTLLEKNYDIRDPSLPPKVPYLMANLYNQMQRWQKTEKLADTVLAAQISWWPPADPNAAEVADKMKTVPRPLQALMWAAGEAKSRRFAVQYQNLLPGDREKLKNEAKFYYDVLSQSDYNSEKTQTFWARTQEREELTGKVKYAVGGYVFLSYWTWEDRLLLSVGSGAATAGHGVMFTPCVGGALSYTNAFYQWYGGGCVGAGKGNVRYDDGTYDSAAQVTLLSGFAGGLRNISEAAAVGIESHILNRTISATSISGTKGKMEDQAFAVLAVGRFRFGKVDLKLKGGGMISSPSALWQLEIAVPVY